MTHYFEDPWADAGDKSSIPLTIQPGGEVSYPEGYGSDYQLDQLTNPDAKDVSRQTDNQLRFDITELLKEIQEKGFLPYRADVNYTAFPAFAVGSDGSVYRSTTANGPDTSVEDPVGDVTGTWIKLGVTTLFENLGGVGDGTVLDWSATGLELSDFDLILCVGQVTTATGLANALGAQSTIAPPSSVVSDTVNVVLAVSGANVSAVKLDTITETGATVRVSNVTWVGSFTGIYGVKH